MPRSKKRCEHRYIRIRARPWGTGIRVSVWCRSCPKWWTQTEWNRTRDLKVSARMADALD